MNLTRYPFATAFLLWQLIACTLPVTTDGQSQTRKLLIEWVRLLNDHDTVGLEKLYADHCELISPNWEGIQMGPAAARTVYSQYFGSTPDLKQEITYLLVTDTALVVEYISEGTFLHPQKGTPEYMQGKKYTLRNCTRMNIRNGKIVKQVNYFDQVSFLRQMGFFEQTKL